jgi:predicted DNA-binding transcriptional regulator AlpA
MSLSIEQWCQRHNLSRSTYYKLKTANKAPRTMEVLGCVRISDDADQEWVKAREAEATEAAAA